MISPSSELTLVSGAPTSLSCPACGGNEFTRVDDVAITELARGWATDRWAAESVGDKPNPQRLAELSREWEGRLDSAIGSLRVAFDRCRGCGLEMSSPRQCWQEGTYTEDENYPIRWEFGRLLDDLGSQPLRILELGAGQGVFLGMAAARGHHVVGLDFNPAAVAVARSRGLEVILGGFDRLREHLLKQEDRVFDAIAMFHVIEHLPNPSSVLSGLSEFIRPGTQIGISCPGPRRYTGMIDVQQVGSRDFWDYPPHHVLRWTPPALRAFLTKLGWETEAVVEEPLVMRDAASQIGVTRALWNGYHHRRSRRWAGIMAARLKVLAVAASRPIRGLSLYTLARHKGR